MIIREPQNFLKYIMQTKDKKENQAISNVELEDWSVKDIADESTNLPSDELQRQMLRGDETKGKADDRDIVGGVEKNETPQGREEAKKNTNDA